MTPERTPAPPDAAPPPAPRRGKRLAGRVLLAAGLTLVGVGVGTAAKRIVGQPPEVAEVEAPAPVVLPPATDAERIDAAVRIGDFAAGLAACKAAPRTAFGGHEGPLVYREALCLEGLGRTAEAADLYAKAAGEYATPAVVGWAVLGRARCAAPRDLPAAGRFVSQVVLTSGGAPELLDECLHARARLAVAALKPAPPPDPFDPTALAWPTTGDDLAGSGGRLLPAALPARPDAPVPVVVSRPLFRPTRVLVTGRLRGQAGADLIRAVGAAAGLGVRIDPGAAANLPAGAALDVTRAPLAEVLTALTEPHGAGWTIDGADLRVGAAVPPGRADAEAALGRALQAAPDHPTAGAARLALANLHAAAGRARDAADGYRRLLADATTTPEAVPAAYNLGLTELREGHVAAARGRFTEVVDRAGARTPWAALGWWWVGRAHLDVGETGPAAKALRAASAGPGAEVVSASHLGLILCHLSNGDGGAARERLDDYRPARVEKHRAAAAAFSALLRYRMAPSAGRAEAVAAALAAAGDGEAFGPLGALFAGRAYAELGRHERAAAVYEAAAARARGPVAVRMTLAVADRYAELGLAAPARQRYLAVAALDPIDLGPRAELRLAELAADAGDAAECVRRCRALLARPGAERAAVLAVLGRGYELAGRYGAAAAAFAGQIPAE